MALKRLSKKINCASSPGRAIANRTFSTTESVDFMRKCIGYSCADRFDPKTSPSDFVNTSHPRLAEWRNSEFSMLASTGTPRVLSFFPSIADRPNSFSSCRAHIENRDNTGPGTSSVLDIRDTRTAASADTLEIREKKIRAEYSLPHSAFIGIRDT